ncbi:MULTISPECIES: XrtN system VIT domain-containing protein [Niastella]|uniref:XrtN system VIT domain-containing protein n=1 Tax=Niastella soli TaxID=2821487 RepID=A0ABS3YMR1_9BACT|nr:XrtN system VIT domain-containing protein [Niastella soli]MBO9199108.1 XrtN system VIT domain-containing protein [Niastella soli]
MSLYPTKTKDGLFITGLVLIPISLFFLCIPAMTIMQQDTLGLFVCNFTITVAYFVLLLSSNRLKKGREGLMPLFLFLILLLISAYSLNREMVVFENTVTWFAVLQIILCINYIAFAYFKHISQWLQLVMVFLLGVSLITFLYIAIYLFPLYVFSLIASFVLGISIHAFVGLLFVIYTIVLVKRAVAGSRILLYALYGGIGVTIVTVVAFVLSWGIITKNINTTYRHATVHENEGWPAWVSLAQHVPQNGLTEKVLKAGLVYSSFSKTDGFFWRVPTKNFGEERKHDPLVVIATLFAGEINLNEENRIKLLESMFDSRHQAQERLWNGDDLITEYINTAVRIWPQFGLAYTEKTLTVSNMKPESSWRNQEEAIYTFHLPEGAVVTALSLWVEGKEAKSILTTKQKADSAYKEIVGVQRRDPSVLHWQEGNTVSVRVFPVLAGESRKFKVGITAPLTRANGKMKYENIYFNGPSVAYAKEAVSLQFQQSPKDFEALAAFTSKNQLTYTRSGSYDASWAIELADQPLSNEVFCFDGKQYALRPYQKQFEAASFETVYLDINKSWTKDEFNSVFDAIKGKKVFVFNNELVQVTNENKDEIFDELHGFQFSLFPVYLIENAGTSLLVSKSNEASPNLNDLAESKFLEKVKESMKDSRKLKIFNLGNTLSPYLKTLKEYRAFQYDHGTVTDLQQKIAKREFVKDIENDKLLVIDNAELAIVEDECNQPATAPDHLLRLFAYNHIMQKMGARFSNTTNDTDELVAEAQKAYVVSPVSSLVVLETQNDYEKFDIKDSQNSLKNASLNSKGAVPEPHEWALIAIACLTLVYIKYYPAKKKMLS